MTKSNVKDDTRAGLKGDWEKEIAVLALSGAAECRHCAFQLKRRLSYKYLSCPLTAFAVDLLII